MQTARADILRAGIDLRRDLRERCHAVLGETQMHSLGLHQRDVLAGERVLGLRGNPDENIAPQRPQFYPNRKEPPKIMKQKPLLRRLKPPPPPPPKIFGP